MFLFCYERDFMSLSGNNQADVIETFNSTLKYLDDLSLKRKKSETYDGNHATICMPGCKPNHGL